MKDGSKGKKKEELKGYEKQLNSLGKEEEGWKKRSLSHKGVVESVTQHCE